MNVLVRVPIVLILVGIVLAGGCSESGQVTTGNGRQGPAKNGSPGQAVGSDGTQPAGETPSDAGDGRAAGTAPAGEPLDADHARLAERLIAGGVDYLLTHRDDDGGWSMGDQRQMQPALTGLALKAVLQDPRLDVSSPQVRGALAVMLGYQQEDGGIYDPAQGKANYTTAVAVMVLAAADDPSLASSLEQAVMYLRGLQILPGSQTADGDVVSDDHPFSGGVGYGEHGRPDLSSVGMWMQAMHDAGVSGDDPAMQRALAFVARTQNRSESNTSAWAAAGSNDGGFVYAPAVRGDLTRGESKAGPGPGGRGLRSYGSMTYVGFKSLLYADLSRRDPRVRAALDWIGRYWRLDSNPNMPYERSGQGLYYYYHAMAKALRAWGEPTIASADGEEHNWRHELIDALAERVAEDGSWINPADRWFEGDANLVTAYAVLALQEALKP